MRQRTASHENTVILEWFSRNQPENNSSQAKTLVQANDRPNAPCGGITTPALDNAPAMETLFSNAAQSSQTNQSEDVLLRTQCPVNSA